MTPECGFKVWTDKKDAVYRRSEKIRISVLLCEDGIPLAGKSVSYTINREKYIPLKGTIISGREPVIIESELAWPGFLLCNLSCEEKKIEQLVGAAVEPLEIKASRPAPADFDEFWQGRKDRLAEIPMNVKMKAVEVPEDFRDRVKCFDIKVDCLSGKPVSGYLAMPLNAAERSLPAIVSYHGAGVRSASKPLDYAADGMLALDVNAHGIENGRSDEYYEELKNGDLSGYRHADTDDRDKMYFHGMFLRVLRALDFIKSIPEWDARTLIAYGGSQGGAQSLVAAGMDMDVTLCISHFPSMCNNTGALDGQSSGGPYFIKMADGKPENENVVKTVPYFDTATFASRIKAETMMSVGFIDVTCPPGSVYVAYNNIKAPKSIVNNPLFGHKLSEESNKATAEKIKEHLAGRR